MSKKEVIEDEVVEDEIEDELEKTDDELREEERQAQLDEDQRAESDDSETGELEEPPPFKLDKPKEEVKAEDKNASDLIDIIHNGQAHRLTREKVIELAQKGFDYDFKVGPHGKLVKMIEADPELAQKVQDHWQEKLKYSDGAVAPEPFQVTALDDYEDESAWLKDNLESLIKHNAIQGATSPVKTAAPVQNNTAIDMLRIRDPENFEKIIPKMGLYAGQLTVDDYYKVDNDTASFIKFYDYVKGRELSKAPGAEKEPERSVSNASKPSFRVRSGGGDAPRTGPSNNAAWNLSKSDFQKQLDKVKGYG